MSSKLATHYIDYHTDNIIDSNILDFVLEFLKKKSTGINIKTPVYQLLETLESDPRYVNISEKILDYLISINLQESITIGELLRKLGP